MKKWECSAVSFLAGGLLACSLIPEPLEARESCYNAAERRYEYRALKCEGVSECLVVEDDAHRREQERCP